MERSLICIVCPLGCEISVTVENGEVKDVRGNGCPRGSLYAESECTTPMRMVTSTVMCDDGELISVKTDRAIPKDKVFECMKIINKATAVLPISVGDVIIEDVFGSNIVATWKRDKI